MPALLYIKQTLVEARLFLLASVFICRLDFDIARILLVIKGKLMAEEMLNKTIGRYEIKELIGEGAMAKVYRAYDPEINRSVAFKVLKEDHCVDDEYLSRFLREAKAAGALSHSSIVTVFDVGKIEKSPYIMMELLDGKDLGEVLKQRKKLSLKETLIISLQLAKALDYAHKSGIVHRDVKPDNIIVLPDGESIKVADFGIARMNETEEAQKTQVGSVLGTPRYMSPEQALGDAVDGRSDLFSVGVIIYEMLTGEKAFDATNMGTLMIQIAQKQPQPIKKYCPSLPAGLRQIVQKLLQKSPEKRFQSGSELAAALSKELSTLQDQQTEQKKHKYLPLKIRWTLLAGAIVTLVLAISISVVFNIQSKTMTKQAVDSGSSFAKFIATETAIPLLSEDWISLDTFISDAASRDTFAYLIVTDRMGIIRGASDITLVGQTYVADETAELISQTDDVHTTSSELAKGGKVFNINTAILFQSTEVGKIILGLSQDSLDEVKSVTGWLMFLLALITISSVAVVMFVFGGLIARPFKVINQSLLSFSQGDFDTRISLTRKDEIGELYNSFNNMAAAIQDQYTGVIDELAQTGIDKTGSNAAQVAEKADSSVTQPAKQQSKPTTLKPEVAAKLAEQDDGDATIIASSLIQNSKKEPVDQSDQTIISTAVKTKPETTKPKAATKKPATTKKPRTTTTRKKATTTAAKTTATKKRASTAAKSKVEPKDETKVEAKAADESDMTIIKTEPKKGA